MISQVTDKKMKLLQNPLLESLTSDLAQNGNRNIHVRGSIESYSCKMTGNDKKLYHKLNMSPKSPSQVPQVLSPPQSQMTYGITPTTPTRTRQLSSCAEDDDDAADVSVISRKLLFTLLSTLNAAFPDYDFSGVKSSEFSREPTLMYVMDDVNTNLSTSLGDEYTDVGDRLWKGIDEEIVVEECEIYSYNPSSESDPFMEDDCLWSFNYFFYNKHLKRVLFMKFHASALMTSHMMTSELLIDQSAVEEEEDQFQMDWMEEGSGFLN